MATREDTEALEALIKAVSSDENVSCYVLSEDKVYFTYKDKQFLLRPYLTDSQYKCRIEKFWKYVGQGPNAYAWREIPTASDVFSILNDQEWLAL